MTTIFMFGYRFLTVESDQRRRDEHMIVEPRRNDLRNRMSEWR